GPLVLSPAPAFHGGDHGELAGLRLWPIGVVHAQHTVGAEVDHAGDGQGPSPECCGAHATPAPSGLAGRRAGSSATAGTAAPAGAWRAKPCRSCKRSTSGSPPRRALAIARAAETPAASVVRHGIP